MIRAFGAPASGRRSLFPAGYFQYPASLPQDVHLLLEGVFNPTSLLLRGLDNQRDSLSTREGGFLNSRRGLQSVVAPIPDAGFQPNVSLNPEAPGNSLSVSKS